MKEFQYGELPFDEWDGFWKSQPSDPDGTGAEYEFYARDLDAKLRRRYSNYPKDFYVRGDFFGDRSQDIEIVNPDVLTLEFLEALQSLLSGDRMWRIRIPTYLDPKAVIVIYPSTICVPKLWHTSGDTTESLQVIRTAMQRAINMDNDWRDQ